MQFLLLLALAHAFTCLLNVDVRPVEAPEIKLVGSGIAAATVVALAWWMGRMRQHAFPHRSLPNWLHHAESLHTVVYFVAMVAVFGGLEFARIARINWMLSRYVLADEFAVVCVLLGPLLLSWICLSDAAAVRNVSAPRWWQRGQYVVLQLRHALLVPLIPILILTGLSDFVRLQLPNGSEAMSVSVTAIGTIVLIFGLPLIVRFAWPTRRLRNGPSRQTLERVFASADVRISQVLWWNTDRRMANAAVTGFLPQLRYLLVTDELLRSLDDRQLAAVAAHEAAHIRHRHFPRLVLSLATPILLLMLLVVCVTPGDMHPFRFTMGMPLGVPAGHTHPTRELPGSLQPVTGLPFWTPILTLGLLSGWLVLHGRLARLFELQADAAACQILEGDGPGEPLAKQSVQLFAESLIAIGADPKGDWLHPRPGERVAQLQRWLNDPVEFHRFRRRLQRISGLQAVLVIGMLLIWLVLA